MTTRKDPRYVEIHVPHVLHGWADDLPMGCWTDDNETEFRAAILDELRYAMSDFVDVNKIKIDIHRAEPDCCHGL